MIRINDDCDGESYRGDQRMTTITQPEKFDEQRDLYRFQPHEIVTATPLPYEQFTPIAVASKDDLPAAYEPLKRYID